MDADEGGQRLRSVASAAAVVGIIQVACALVAWDSTHLAPVMLLMGGIFIAFFGAIGILHLRFITRNVTGAAGAAKAGYYYGFPPVMLLFLIAAAFGDLNRPALYAAAVLDAIACGIALIWITYLRRITDHRSR